MNNLKIVLLFMVLCICVGFSALVVINSEIESEPEVYQLICVSIKSGELCHVRNLMDKTILCVGTVDGYEKEVLIRPHSRSRYSLSKSAPVITYCRVR